jgi:hypothetical protein
MDKITMVDSRDGGLRRLELVKCDPMTMSVIAEWVAEGHTLKDIAQEWMPYGCFICG